jgi:hypothetical protein
MKRRKGKIGFGPGNVAAGYLWRAIPSAFGGHLRVRGGEHWRGIGKTAGSGRTIEQYDYPMRRSRQGVGKSY